MKTRLDAADRDKMWRAIESTFLHYAYEDGCWRVYPCDPRQNPSVLSIRSRVGEGVELRGGFVEVP